jgi:AAA domain-containing protein
VLAPDIPDNNPPIATVRLDDLTANSRAEKQRSPADEERRRRLAHHATMGAAAVSARGRGVPYEEAKRRERESEAAAKAERQREWSERVAKAKAERDAKAKGTISIRTGDKFRAEYQPLEYVIDRIMPKGTLMTITGPGNVGKTAFGMMIAGHKSNGKPLNSWDVPQGHVLYASAENTIDFRHRYIAMFDNWPGFDESRFHVLTSLEKNGLTNNIEVIEAYIAKLDSGLDLIIVDTQAAWSTVEDEANNAEQLNYARALRSLCGLAGSPAVGVLSHPTKTPTKVAECRPRGGVAFENETDANLTLWQSDELVEVAYTRLRVPRWDPFCIRIREIETTSVVDIKGRPLRSVRAEMVSTGEAKAAQASKPTKKAKWQQALDVLDNTLVDYPELPPDRRKYPGSRTLTKVARFRQALVSAGIMDADDLAKSRDQWRNIKDKLQSEGYLRIEGELCWRP